MPCGAPPHGRGDPPEAPPGTRGPDALPETEPIYRLPGFFESV